MIAPLERVKGMALIPHACVLCANNPSDEVTGEQKDAIFAPGVDVDWGSSVYVCKSCVEIMADLFDRVSLEDHKELKKEYETLLENFEALQEHYDRDSALLDRIRDGKQAVKEVKSTRKAA